jgi:hypothetical protein
MFVIALPHNKSLVVCASTEVADDVPTTAIVRLNSGGALKQKDLIQEDGLGGSGVRPGDIGKLDGLADQVHVALAAHDLVYVCCKSGHCRSTLVALIYLYRHNHQTLQSAINDVLQASGWASLHKNTDAALSAYCTTNTITRLHLRAV